MEKWGYLERPKTPWLRVAPKFHPKPFKMTSAPALPGGGMHERAACGACHDGKKAFAADDPETCTRCHVEGGAKP